MNMNISKIAYLYNSFQKWTRSTYPMFESLQWYGILILYKMLHNKVNRNWQAGLPRPKFSYESLSPRPLYHILSPKSQKKKDFATRKLLRALKLLRFVSGRVLFRFLSDRIESSLGLSVTGSSLGYSVKGSFLRPQWMLFFRVFSDRVLSWIISLLYPE